jgi:hypothetical protein
MVWLFHPNPQCAADGGKASEVQHLRRTTTIGNRGVTCTSLTVLRPSAFLSRQG